MIDGNLTEPNSLSEPLLDRPPLEKSGSFPSVMSDNIDKSFPMDEKPILLGQTSEQNSVDKASEATGAVEPKTDANIVDITADSVPQSVTKELPLNESSKLITISNNSSETSKDWLKPSEELPEVELFDKQLDESVHKRRTHLTKSRTESCDLGRPVFPYEIPRQRRSRSLSKSPDKSMVRPHSGRTHSCGRHHYQCRQCGAGVSEPPPTVPSLTINKNVFSLQNFKSFSIDTTYHNSLADDDEDLGIHTESYRSALWLYVGRKDELIVWGHKCHKKSRKSSNNEKLNGSSPQKLVRCDSNESTLSERQFRRQYESVTHRMIHRRASIEMYKRAINKTFEKEIIIHRINNEFGFRIHGSRPVVVSAIEKDTPAETCGLDVGDIVVTINGSNVMDASHSDVVKLAHSGADTLTLEVVSTRAALNGTEMNGESSSTDSNTAYDIVMNGYLTRVRVTNDSDSQSTQTRNRWFALKTDNCLYWYKSTKEMDPLGVLCLQGYTSCLAPELTVQQPYAFKLAKPGAGIKYLAAKDSETVNQWVDAINQRAFRLNKADPYVEMALKNVTKSVSGMGTAGADCSGYLAIFSQRRKCWRNRYFVLKDASLYFYYDSNAKTSLGMRYYSP
ncbi:unnamed protein product, partial [Oppiella nova]